VISLALVDWRRRRILLDLLKEVRESVGGLERDLPWLDRLW
jgi:hypothetical protein